MSPLPPTKDGGTFFIKMLLGGAIVFGANFFGGCFTWGLMMRSCKGGVNGSEFQRSSQVSFSSHWPWPGLLIYYLKS